MKIQQQTVGQGELTKVPKKKPATKAKKEPKDIRYVFRKNLKELDLPKLKKPWMAQKAFRLITTPEALQAWVDSVLNDTSRHIDIGGVLTPVIALDTETMGLDTRILVDRVQRPDGSWEHIYEVNIELAGICLSSDGMDGIYIPVNHEKKDQGLTTAAENIDREKCAEILQYLFDRSHLVFYNAKFDREVLRLTMGINFRPYPHFEDVQVLAYINDPKADLGDKGSFTGGSGGLKALSKNVLGIDQIELEEIAKVKVDYCPLTGSPFCSCSPEQRKAYKHTLKNQFAPFTWIPTDIALWYAAGDAICTWLLWQRMYELARSRKLIHRIDHELVESITWIERQRWTVDSNRLARTIKGHRKKLDEMRAALRLLALQAGYEETKQDDGSVLADDQFNPGSTMQLQTLLFKVKEYTVTRFTETGNPSCDAEALEDLFKQHPEDKFLETIMNYRDYMALHPDSLRFDPRDQSARIYLKQNVVAGGRLAAAGGDFEKDGGFGLNPQGIKKIESYLMWKVTGNVLDPDPEELLDENIEAHEENDLHPSCFKEVEVTENVVTYRQATDWETGLPRFYEAGGKPIMEEVVEEHKHKVRKAAPGIIKNHIGKYMGYAVCLVPSCTTCAEKYGILIEGTKVDANEVVNLRCLFHAPPGWTLFTVDYGNIEMRCLAGDTKVLIKNKGCVPLKDNVGTQILLNSKKEWVEGEIKSFGTQSLRRVVIGHNKVNHNIYATQEHRWILANGQEKITDELSHGDEIPFISKNREPVYDSPDYLLGVRHGIIYGDGSRALSGRKGKGAKKDGVIAVRRQRGYKIRLCGEDKHLLVPYFEGYKVTYPENFGGDSVVYLYDEFTATHDLKQLPDKDETEAYLVGFLRGWLAADGHAGTSGVSLCCGVEEEEWVREVMSQFGFYFLDSSEITVATYLCSACKSQVKTIKPVKRPRVCVECRTPIAADAPVVLKESKFQRRSYQHKKRSKCLAFFRPSMMDADFLLPHKLKGFRDHYFELHETVRRVEITDRKEEVFCAVVPGTHDFVIENGLLTGNCAANVSGEPEFINEFLIGKGDFHSLTASKVFPEFTDPNTSKAIRKSLRDLAKIINFALLYGGTEYTIFENMKKKKPDITWEEAKAMVARYWDGVPVFFEWCQTKQSIAKNEMLCKTTTGRVISFKSAMEAQHIHEPTKGETDNYWAYRDWMKKSEAAKKDGDPEKAASCRAKADRMWKDSDTGVRNYMDYNRFMGKIQRVSVNVPLQGLAGDFMRMALNRIRKWVESDPLVQTVFHLHCSVHDEIDFIVKNEYVPFVLPRITRLMKLRKLHEKMNWKVPIESDAEYGRSWDVEHHVTGDDDHKPAAWTEIKEVANYIPDEWEVATLKNLLQAIGSDNPARVEKARDFLKESLHPRAFIAASHVFTAKDDSSRKKALIAALQLDEYWRIDHTPDDDDASMEIFEAYERRMELGPENRDPLTPEFGYLGAIPLTATVKRPTVEILGEPVELEDIEVIVSSQGITVTTNTPVEYISVPVELPKEPEPEPETVVELIDLDEESSAILRKMMGVGFYDIRIIYQGQFFVLKNKARSVIPEEFVKAIRVISEVS